MALNLLIEHIDSHRRGVIDPVTLPEMEVRGWAAVGLCSDPNRDPLLTDAEFDAAQILEMQRLAALLESDVVPDVAVPLDTDSEDPQDAASPVTEKE